MRLLGLSILILSSMGLNAQSLDAIAILKKSKVRYQEASSFKSGYVTKLFSEGELIEEKQGNLFLEGSKFKVDISGLVAFTDGRYFWEFDEELNEVIKSKFSVITSEYSYNTRKMLTYFEEGMICKFLAKSEIRGSKVVVIECTDPAGSALSYSTSYIDTNNFSLKKLIYSMSGDFEYEYHHEFINEELNIPLDENEFLYDKKRFEGARFKDMTDH